MSDVSRGYVSVTPKVDLGQFASELRRQITAALGQVESQLRGNLGRIEGVGTDAADGIGDAFHRAAERMADDFSEATAEIRSDLGRLAGTGLNEVEAEARQVGEVLATSFDRAGDEARRDAGTIGDAFAAAGEQAEDALRELARTGETQMHRIQPRDALGRFVAEGEIAEDALREVGNTGVHQMDRIQNRSTGLFQNLTQGFHGTALRAAVAFGTIFGITRLVQGFDKAFDLTADFQKSLSTLGAVADATQAQMDQVGQVAQDLGNDLTLPNTSAVDAAEAMLELAKGGLTVDQAMAAAKGTLQLAAAAEIEESRAAEIAAGALSSFGLEAKEASRVGDLLAASANASLVEIDDMALALQQASAVFNSAKIPIEDTVAAIALLGQAGIKGSDAGTSLKSMMLHLEGPSGVARKEMARLGLEVYDAAGNLKSLREIIAEVTDATKNLTQEERDAALTRIFGSDGIRAINILLAKGVEGYDAMSAAVQREGAAADLAAAKTKGLGGALEGLKSLVEGEVLKAMLLVSPALETLIRGFSALTPALGPIFTSLATVVTTLLPALGGALAAILPALGPVFASIATAIATLLVPLGEAITLIVTKAGPAFGELVTGLATAVAPLITVLGQLLATILPPLATAFGGVVAALAPIIDIVAQVAGVVLGALAPMLTTLGELMGLLGRQFGEAIAKIAASPEFASFLSTLATALAVLAPAVVDVVTAFAGIQARFFVTLLEAITPLLPVLAELGGTVMAALASVLTILTPLIVEMAAAFTPVLVGVVGKLVELFVVLAPALGRVVSEGAAQLADVFVQLRPAIEKLVPALADLIVQLVDKLVPVLPELIPAVVDLAKANAQLLIALLPLVGPLTDLATLLISVLTPVVVTEMAVAMGILAKAVEVLAFNVDKMTHPLDTLRSLGGVLADVGGVVKEAAGRLVAAARDLTGTVVGALLDAVKRIPGLLFEIPGILATALGTAIGAGIAAMVYGVVIGIPTVVDWIVAEIRKIPGRLVEVAGVLIGIGAGLVRLIIDGIGSLLGELRDAALGIVKAVVEEIARLPDQLVDLVERIVVELVKLPTRLRDQAGDFADVGKHLVGALVDGFMSVLGEGGQFALQVANAIIGLFNKAIDGFNDAAHFGPIDLPDIPRIPSLEGKWWGDIVDKPTIARLAEHGREAVLPLTRPARSAELALRSGLLDIIAPYLTPGDWPAAAGAGGVVGALAALPGPGGAPTPYPPELMAMLERVTNAVEAPRVGEMHIVSPNPVMAGSDVVRTLRAVQSGVRG